MNEQIPLKSTEIFNAGSTYKAAVHGFVVAEKAHGSTES